MVNLREFFRMTFGCRIMAKKRRWQRKHENDSHPSVQSEPKSFMVFVVQNVRFSCRFAYKPLIPTNQPVQRDIRPLAAGRSYWNCCTENDNSWLPINRRRWMRRIPRRLSCQPCFFPLGLVSLAVSWMLRDGN